MDTLTWVLQGLLAVAFLMAGGMKLAQSKEKVIASGGKWANDFGPATIKVIGVVEILCALGISLPKLLGHGYLLTSFSAMGLMAIMVGAFVTHLRRKETPFLFVTAILFCIAAAVAYLRMPQMS